MLIKFLFDTASDKAYNAGIYHAILIQRYKYLTECYSHLYEVATKSAQFSD